MANNPAGEITLNMGITGPHYTIGAACAAGNAGLIQGAQMLRLGECDVAIAGGVSESIRTFGIFAGFASQGALAKHDDPTKASRPFDRTATASSSPKAAACTCSSGFDDAKQRGAKIYGELVGYAMNSDASDFVLPNPAQQARCMNLALQRAGLNAEDIDLVSTHATATASGDIQECIALRNVFRNGSQHALVNNTKSFIGHAMGAAGALELAGNLPAFDDGVCHRDDQRRPARSRVCTAGPGAQRAARAERRPLYPQQLVWYVGDQLGGDYRESLTGSGFQATVRSPVIVILRPSKVR